MTSSEHYDEAVRHATLAAEAARSIDDTPLQTTAADRAAASYTRHVGLAHLHIELARLLEGRPSTRRRIGLLSRQGTALAEVVAAAEQRANGAGEKPETT